MAPAAVAVRRRVYHDELRPGGHAAAQALVQDGMAVRHVRADHQKTVRVLEVLVVARRPVRAERELVAAGRAGHAQARVAVDVVGAQEAFGELVGDVLRLAGELPGNVERHGVGSMGVNDPPELAGHRVERHVERDFLERPISASPLCVREPVGRADRLVDRAALRAEAAEIGGMVPVAADTVHASVFDVQNHPATDAAVRADGLVPTGRWRGGDGHGVALKPGRADPRWSHYPARSPGR